MARKAAAGNGSIRKITVEKNGKIYTYWQARYTLGTNPGTGAQEQRSIYGKTQKEVARKLREIEAAIEAGSYSAPDNITVGQWLDFWGENFLVSQKDSTKQKYLSDIRLHIKPGIGAVRLQDLRTEDIQALYNKLDLSAKSKRNIHGTLHKALDKARKLGKIPFNPCDDCELAKPEKHQITPLPADELVRFVDAAKSDPLGNLLIFMVFTGLRRNEALGLSWKGVNFRAGSVTISQQLKLEKGGVKKIVPTKSSNVRTIYPAKIAMDALLAQKRIQNTWAIEYAEVWENPYNLAFTWEDGRSVSPNALRLHNNTILEAAGLEHHRLHDLRDTFAVTALQAGDDIKTVQESLGHADASFTLNVYLTSLDDMKKKSSNNIQDFFNAADSARKKGTQKTG